MRGSFESVLAGDDFDDSFIEGNTIFTLDTADELLDMYLRRAPRLGLEQRGYNLLVSLLQQLLSLAAEEDNSFSIIRKVYRVSRVYAMLKDGVPVPVALGLRGAKAFHLTKLWVESTRLLVHEDIQRWVDATQNKSLPELLPLTSLPRTQLFALFSVLRIQAMVSTMQFLHLPFDCLVRYFMAVGDEFGLADTGIDLNESICHGFKAWLLEQAELSSERHFLSPRVAALRAGGLEVRLVDELGYSALMELMLSLPERMRSRHGKLILQADTEDTEDASFFQCVCGAAANSWTPLVAHQGSQRVDEDCKIPRVLCELCFRQLYSNPVKSDGLHRTAGLCVVPRVKAVPPKSFETFFQSAADSPTREKRHYNFSCLNEGALRPARDHAPRTETKLSESEGESRAASVRLPALAATK